MADHCLAPCSALPRPLAVAGPSPAGIVVSERVGLGIATVQGRRGQADALRERLQVSHGLEAPSGPRRVAAGGTALLGTAPATWLAIQEEGGNTLAATLARDLAGIASVADQADAYLVLRLTGARVPDALAKGMTIDLNPRVFRPNHVAVTTAAHIGLILWRLEDAAAPVYELAVSRSYAESLAGWLSASAAEFGLAPA